MDWTPTALDALAGELPLAQQSPALTIQAQADGSQELSLDGIVGWDFTAGSVRRALRDVGNADLTVRINSFGGSVFDGFAIHNTLSRHKGRVTVLVDAVAASAASVIAMAGAEIIMPRNAFLMVHNAWTITMGDYREHDKGRDLLQRLSAAIAAVYAARSGRDQAELQQLMDAETWLGAEDAIGAGLATRIEGDAQAAAVEGDDAELLARYQHPPEALLSRLPQVLAEARPMLVGKTLRGPTGPRGYLHQPRSSTTPKPARPAQPKEARMDPENPQPPAPAAASITELEAISARAPGVLDAQWVLNQAKAGVTVQAARDAAFEALAATTPPRGPTARIDRDERDTFRARASGALAARFSSTAPAAEHREFYSLGLQGLLRECLAQAGVNGVHRLSNEQVLDRIRAEHTTSDFPIILRDAANRRLADKYAEYPQTWKDWTREVDLTDFRTNEVGELGNFPKLKPKPESASVRYGTVSEASEKYRLMTGASGIVLSREAIINDDLNAFQRMLDDAADVSYAWVADQVYAVITLNPSMADGQALFSTAHKNVVTQAMLPAGVDLGLDEENLGVAEELLLDQTTLSGDVMAPPTRLILLVGGRNAIMARKLATAVTPNNQADVPAYAGRLTPVVEPRLRALGNGYILVAGNRPTVEVGYLAGRRVPELTSMEDFDTKGMRYALVFDAVAAPVSSRGMVKHPGAA